MRLAAQNQLGRLAQARHLAGSEVILYEDCDGEVATIDGRPPNVGANNWFVVSTGTKVIQTDGAGEFTTSTGSGTPYGLIDIDINSYTLTLDITISAWTVAMIRWVDSSNHWDVGLNSTNGLFIRERTSGSATTRASKSVSLTNLQKYSVEIVVTPTSITLNAAGDSISYSSASKASSTILGVAPRSSSAGSKWDEITARSAA